MSAQVSPLVSVIVPIYNVEKYLPKCLDSILSQSLKDIEVIGVDDGSTDRSGEILDNYADRDSRVRVVHQLNAGLGPARNAGISFAKGLFIGFVDSDDWVHSDFFESLYHAAVNNHSDIAIGGIETWTDGKLAEAQSHPLAGSTLHNYVEIAPYRKLLYGRLPNDHETKPFPVSVWAGIYRAEIIRDCEISFDDVLSEDVFFNLDTLKAAKSVTYLNKNGYCYRKDCQESITRTYKESTLSRYVAFFQKLYFYAQDEYEADECVLRANRKILDYARSLSFMIEKSDLSYRQKCSALRNLISLREFKDAINAYPIEKIPLFQSVFLKALIGGNFALTLLLVRIRMMIRGEK